MESVFGNRNHRRVLESSLLIIEKYITDALRILQRDNSGSLSEIVNDIDEKRKPEICDLMGNMLHEIKEFSLECSLNKQKEFTGRKLLALMSGVWVILEEIDPEKINAQYGRMPEDIQSILTSHREALLKKVELVTQLIEASIKRTSVV
ncbi:MAG: hypothetical protein FGF48_10815 [Candidatus Brockarchaeota archaeon]|nr:hypothetical protein [Candidatus Brockarchaeota archaeon]